MSRVEGTREPRPWWRTRSAAYSFGAMLIALIVVVFVLVTPRGTGTAASQQTEPPADTPTTSPDGLQLDQSRCVWVGLDNPRVVSGERHIDILVRGERCSGDLTLNVQEFAGQRRMGGPYRVDVEGLSPDRVTVIDYDVVWEADVDNLVVEPAPLN